MQQKETRIEQYEELNLSDFELDDMNTETSNKIPSFDEEELDKLIGAHINNDVK